MTLSGTMVFSKAAALDFCNPNDPTFPQELIGQFLFFY